MNPTKAQSPARELKKGRLHREFYRNGDDHRAGADVSFQDVLRLFRFRSIEIGKWVTEEEKRIAANLFFDALCDLMDILQVPENVISLNGTLSLGFGVGGQKHASAHYNSAKKQLSLAKNAGAGALAHEWFHAFDHYIASKMFKVSGSNLFASEIWLNENASMHIHALNEQLASCFRYIFLDKAGNAPSELMTKSVFVDQQLKSFYYARPQEVAARSFEACIQHQSIKNAFLVQGTMKSAEAKLGIYPHGSQLNDIATQLKTYFNWLGKALDHSVTDA
ncbi:CLCA_X family protein [Glaciecola sp. MF2-115]|uniref:CLCA_X family protein n=1 Tax=Glaciecola sp. MF2-115 TaxID=3384827 RepID=UPI0039A1BD06